MLEQMYLVVETMDDEFYQEEVIGVFDNQEQAQQQVNELCEQEGAFIHTYNNEDLDHFFVRVMSVNQIHRD